MRRLWVLLSMHAALVLSLLVDVQQAMVPEPPGTPQTPDLPPCPFSCNCSYSPSPLSPSPLLTLDCRDAGLTNFPQPTPNASQVLLLSDNRLLNLSSLPPLPNLRLLDLSNNCIAFLDNHWVFEHMGLLTKLNLRGNALRTLKHGSFSGLTSLDELDLSDNHIKTVELHAFSGLNQLSVLRLANNQLYQLKRKWLLAMTSLTELYVQGNYLSVIESNTFDKIHSLLHLDISDNSVRQVEDNGFRGLDHVKVLNMSENNLVTIPTRELQRLCSLDILLLDGIKVSSLEDGDFHNMNVSSISLSFLPSLRVVNKGAFSHMLRLRTLQLHDNPQLLFINPHAFSQVPLLHRLFLHNNQLITLSSAIKDALPRLDDLHLYHNKLHCDCNILWLKRDMDSGSQGSYIKDADKLQCNSPAFQTDMFLKHVALQLLSQAVCPPTAIPFFFGTHNVSIGDDLRLECQAIGVPEPDLYWILPDGRVINSSTDTHNMVSADNTVLTIPGMQLSDQGTYACMANNSMDHDTSSTAVHVHNKDLRLVLTASANNFITVAWVGSIPRRQMANFQIRFRKNEGDEDYKKVYLHGGMHRCTLTNLKPMTSYEICIVYRDTYSVQCRNFSTDHRVALAQPAITRINLTRIGAITCAVVGVVMVLCLVKVITQRLRKRKDYQDPLKEGGEMDKIPLEPIDQRAPETPLCSSRTALLPHSQI